MRFAVVTLLAAFALVARAQAQSSEKSLGVYAPQAEDPEDGSGRYPEKPDMALGLSRRNLSWFAGLCDAMCERVDVPSADYEWSADKTARSFAGCPSPQDRGLYATVSRLAAPPIAGRPMEIAYDGVRAWLHDATNAAPRDVGGIRVYPLSTGAYHFGTPGTWTVFQAGGTSHDERRAFDMGNPYAGPAIGRIDETGAFFGGQKPEVSPWTNTILKAWMDGLLAAGFNSVDADENPSYFSVDPSDPGSADSRSVALDYAGGDLEVPVSTNRYNASFDPPLTNIISSAPALSAAALVGMFDRTAWSVEAPVEYVVRHEELDAETIVDVAAASNSIAQQGASSGEFSVDFSSYSRVVTNRHDVTMHTNSAVTLVDSEVEVHAQIIVECEWELYYNWQYSDVQTSPWTFVKSVLHSVDQGQGRYLYTRYDIYQCEATYSRYAMPVRTVATPTVTVMGEYGRRSTIKDEVIELKPRIAGGWPSASAVWSGYCLGVDYYLCGVASCGRSSEAGSSSVTAGVFGALSGYGTLPDALFPSLATWPMENPPYDGHIPVPPPLPAPAPVGGRSTATLPPPEYYSGLMTSVNKYSWYVPDEHGQGEMYDGSTGGMQGDYASDYPEDFYNLDYSTGRSPTYDGGELELDADGVVRGKSSSERPVAQRSFVETTTHSAPYCFGVVHWLFIDPRQF